PQGAPRGRPQGHAHGRVRPAGTSGPSRGTPGQGTSARGTPGRGTPGRGTPGGEARRPLVTGELRVAAEVIHRAERNGHQDRAQAGAVGRRRGEVIPLPGGEGADEQPDGEHHQEHAHGHLRTPGREAVTGPSPATFSVIPARAASRKPRPRRREQKPLCGYSGSALR